MGDDPKKTTPGAPPATDLAGIQRQVHEFVRMSFLFDGGDPTFDDGASLMEEGIVDDTGVLELVLFVEETWGLSVDPQDLLPDNFDSVNAIAAYVARHLPSR